MTTSTSSISISKISVNKNLVASFKGALKTNEGNFLVSDEEISFFCDASGVFLRSSSFEEFEFLLSRGLEFSEYIQGKCKIPSRWELLEEFEFEDYSQYDERFSCNGGAYAFFTTTKVFKRTLGERVQIAVGSWESSSSDFPMDDSGRFMSGFAETLNHICPETGETFRVSDHENSERLTPLEEFPNVGVYEIPKNVWKKTEEEILKALEKGYKLQTHYGEKLPYSKEIFSNLRNGQVKVYCEGMLLPMASVDYTASPYNVSTPFYPAAYKWEKGDHYLEIDSFDFSIKTMKIIKV